MKTTSPIKLGGTPMSQSKGECEIDLLCRRGLPPPPQNVPVLILRLDGRIFKRYISLPLKFITINLWSTCKIVTQIYDTIELKKLNESESGVLLTMGRSKHKFSPEAIPNRGPKGRPRTELRKQEFFIENTK